MEEPPNRLTTQKEIDELVTQYEGPNRQPKEEEIEQGFKQEPDQGISIGGLEEDTGYETPATQTESRSEPKDASSGELEKDTGFTIRKHAAYIKKTFPNFRERSGKDTYSR